MIAVYIAGPYSASTPEDIERNVWRAMEAGDVVEDAGLRAFIPHLSHYRHQRRPRHYEAWMEIDFDWLSRCDALLRLPGKSSGGDREVDYAMARGIPVFTDTGPLLTWAKERQ